MATVDVRNEAGKEVRTLDLPNEVYDVEPNLPVIHQVVVNFQSSARQGTSAVKGRSEVSGGGRKPWRQKGTGRARQGSIRAAQWRGGGVVFGPTPRSHEKRTNRKTVKLAMRGVLSAKLDDGELFIAEPFDFGKPSTKKAVAFLKGIGAEGKRVTLVLPVDDEVTYLSFRNIPRVDVVSVDQANAVNLLNNGVLVLEESVANRLGEVLQ